MLDSSLVGNVWSGGTIQIEFLPHAQYFCNSFQSHQNHNQEKPITEDEQINKRRVFLKGGNQTGGNTFSLLFFPYMLKINNLELNQIAQCK